MTVWIVYNPSLGMEDTHTFFGMFSSEEKAKKRLAEIHEEKMHGRRCYPRAEIYTTELDQEGYWGYEP